ncbi:MAG: CDP-diacylglycerol--glycerol-3-phosphate 3-phosphatidyltransferase [Pirellulales bacterium]
MAASTKESETRPPPGLGSSALNLPNQLTWARLFLSVVMFALLAVGVKDGNNRTVFIAALVLFCIAAGTDWLDGYLARKYNLVTTLGRILDPFADKVVICGTFIFLASLEQRGSGVAAWMVVVIVGRELLVTALRSFLEQQGADFSASLSGKLKMVLQCAAAIASFVALASYQSGTVPHLASWLSITRDVLIWSAVVLTIVSGAAYVRAAIRLLGG